MSISIFEGLPMDSVLILVLQEVSLRDRFSNYDYDYHIEPSRPSQSGSLPPLATQPVFAGTHTTPVVNQPAPLISQRGLRDWNSGLRECCDDCHSCEYLVLERVRNFARPYFMTCRRLLTSQNWFNEETNRAARK